MMTKSVVLPLDQAAAFDLFTASISEWWPADRRHIVGSASQIFLLEAGGFFERATDGRQVALGQVRFWQCPDRILLDFYVATGADKPTEVEITFTSEGDGTRVTVVHRPKPESAAIWADRVARYARSWVAVLAALAQRAACQA